MSLLPNKMATYLSAVDRLGLFLRFYKYNNIRSVSDTQASQRSRALQLLCTIQIPIASRLDTGLCITSAEYTSNLLPRQTSLEPQSE